MKIHRSLVAVATAALLFAGAVAIAQTPPSDTAGALRQARAYQYQLRVGRTEGVDPAVKMLEAAVQSDPQSADLWNALGNAYLAKANQVAQSGRDFAELGQLFPKGIAALERALAINPHHPEALAAHGGISAIMAVMRQRPGEAAGGVAEMNRAVKLAPDSVAVRLQRAFTSLNLPVSIRDRTAEAEDLAFLARVAGGSREGDYVRLLQADLLAEGGQTEQATALYEQVGRAGSPAAATARQRLAAAGPGSSLTADMTRLRLDTTRCVMCHGQG